MHRRWGSVVRLDGTESAVGRFPQPYVRLPGASKASTEDEDEEDE